MRPVSLIEAESVIIGTKFEYRAPKGWEDESGLNWVYPDSRVDPSDIPVLEAMEGKKLVVHIEAVRWPNMVDSDCWVLTDHGLSVFSWFHAFPENYGL